VRRAIGKNDEEVAVAMMLQIKDRWNPIEPPEISSDGNDGYPEAMLGTWGKLPEYVGWEIHPTRKQPQPGWKCLQVSQIASRGAPDDSQTQYKASIRWQTDPHYLQSSLWRSQRVAFGIPLKSLR
jgi:hypothetical protein